MLGEELEHIRLDIRTEKEKRTTWDFYRSLFHFFQFQKGFQQRLLFKKIISNREYLGKYWSKYKKAKKLQVLSHNRAMVLEERNFLQRLKKNNWERYLQ